MQFLNQIERRLGSKKGVLALLVMAISIGINLPFILSFVAPGLDLYLALMALPFCLVIEHKGAFSLRYGWLAIVLALAYYMLQVQTLYLLAVFALFSFMVEITIGKLNKAFFLIGVLISPIFHYLLNVFSFPIRLKITAIATNILGFAIEGVTVSGNIISLKGNAYEVETACLGLNMLVTGAILSLAILAFNNHKLQRKISNAKFGIWVLIAAVLLIGSNLFRIILLVLFNIAPEQISHDFIGLLALGFYVLLPLWFITPKLITGQAYTKNDDPKTLKMGFAAIPLLSAMILMAGAQKFESYKNEVQNLVYHLPNGLIEYEPSQPYADVFKFKNEASVIFYKPCKSYYNSTHTPTICWRGSGLKLKNETLTHINGKTILTAVLQNDSLQLHTAWWYQSDQNITIDQMEWRMDVLKNKSRYTLVNVSAFDKDKLNELLSQYFLK